MGAGLAAKIAGRALVVYPLRSTTISMRKSCSSWATCLSVFNRASWNWSNPRISLARISLRSSGPSETPTISKRDRSWISTSSAVKYAVGWLWNPQATYAILIFSLLHVSPVQSCGLRTGTSSRYIAARRPAAGPDHCCSRETEASNFLPLATSAGTSLHVLAVRTSRSSPVRPGQAVECDFTGWIGAQRCFVTGEGFLLTSELPEDPAPFGQHVRIAGPEGDGGIIGGKRRLLPGPSDTSQSPRLKGASK